VDKLFDQRAKYSAINITDTVKANAVALLSTVKRGAWKKRARYFVGWIELVCGPDAARSLATHDLTEGFQTQYIN